MLFNYQHMALLAATTALLSRSVTAFQPARHRLMGVRRVPTYPASFNFRLFGNTFLASAKDTEATSRTPPSGIKKPVPITLLSGFLGTGKTTTLKHLLENTSEVKIGVIVNDVASVNIDAKLISGQSGDMVELQNGCACCSLADELFFSVEQLVSGRELDAVVVELSGVADPMAIKNNWIMAPPYVKEIADVARVVTVVDAASFGTDYLTWDMAGERNGWVEPGDDHSANRKVAELLAEQVEAADLILVNKVDIANEEEIKVTSGVAKALNEKAELSIVEFGRISPQLVLGDLSKKDEECSDPDCADPSHSHSHSHDHATSSCNDPGCADPSHSHSHSHDHAASSCNDPECNDPSHSHSRSHDTDCSDPTCTDSTHPHSHSHATSTDQLGIVNFVYKAAVPFNGLRLMNVLNKWPVPIKETLDVDLVSENQPDGYEINGKHVNDSPFIGVLRSKGFCWFAPYQWSGANEDAWRHDTAMYWSHAGKHFGISSAGKWWGTLPDDKMKKYFVSNMGEYERIKREDFVTEEFGDRRQEIVFIGTNLDEEGIRRALDECLCTEQEMNDYRQKLGNYQNTILNTKNRGLFDVAGTDYTDL